VENHPQTRGQGGEKLENMAADSNYPSNFIRNIVAEDVQNHKYGGRVVTRFPPNPTATCT